MYSINPYTGEIVKFSPLNEGGRGLNLVNKLLGVDASGEANAIPFDFQITTTAPTQNTVIAAAGIIGGSIIVATLIKHL